MGTEVESTELVRDAVGKEEKPTTPRGRDAEGRTPSRLNSKTISPLETCEGVCELARVGITSGRLCVFAFGAVQNGENRKAESLGEFQREVCANRRVAALDFGNGVLRDTDCISESLLSQIAVLPRGAKVVSDHGA